jgi:hypothetical protein
MREQESIQDKLLAAAEGPVITISALGQFGIDILKAPIALTRELYSE